MFALEDILYTFADLFTGYAAMVVCLFAVMDERGWRRVKKLPILLLAPLLAAFVALFLYAVIPETAFVRYWISSCFNLLAFTLWTWWAWQTRFWWAFAATCMAGVFQVAVSTLSRMLLRAIPLDRGPRFLVTLAVFWVVVLTIAALLYRLRFGCWFRLLLEDGPASVCVGILRGDAAPDAK